jgi:hypothetical protein
MMYRTSSRIRRPPNEIELRPWERDKTTFH